ncbi:MAG: type II toxin-antitoxin system RelE/ParE family toxin [Flavobacteriaceae bacterium]|nr:type II toxin-antitoxin system RelE/ParE family toxin [Flavobacteriaceae bacterium]
MILKVIWSDFAEKQLDEIFEYYFKNISNRTAKKIAGNILLETKKLGKTPFIGQMEDLLIDRNTEYRYLIYTNYKIIYSVDEPNGFVKIADIFDSRQNPVKVKRKK